MENTKVFYDKTALLVVGSELYTIPMETVYKIFGYRIEEFLDEDYESDNSRKYIITRPKAPTLALIDYCHTGKLHIPENVCKGLFEMELFFWGINPNVLEKCCFHQFCKFVENRKNLEGFERMYKKKNHDQGVDRTTRQMLWAIVDCHKDSVYSKVYFWISVVFLVMVVANISLSTLQDEKEAPMSSNMTEESGIGTTAINPTKIPQNKILDAIPKTKRLDPNLTDISQTKSIDTKPAKIPKNKTTDTKPTEIPQAKTTTQLYYDDLSIPDNTIIVVTCDICQNVSSDAFLWQGETKSSLYFGISKVTVVSPTCCRVTAIDDTHVSSSNYSQDQNYLDNYEDLTFNFPQNDTLNTNGQPGGVRVEQSNTGRGDFLYDNVSLLNESSNASSYNRPLLDMSNLSLEINVGKFVIKLGEEAKDIADEKLSQIVLRTELKDLQGLNVNFITEQLTSLFFTTELILRLISCPSKKEYFKSVLNWFDIVLVISSISRTTLSVWEDARNSVGILYDMSLYLQMFRVFRLFRLVENVKAFKVLHYSVMIGCKDICVLTMSVLVMACFFSNFIYFAERKSEFPSIPAAWWWSIVTMTTVGYGDMVPQSAFGKLIGCFCALSGIVLFSLIIPVFVNTFLAVYEYAHGSDGKKIHDIQYIYTEEKMITKSTKLSKRSLSLDQIYSLESGITVSCLNKLPCKLMRPSDNKMINAATDRLLLECKSNTIILNCEIGKGTKVENTNDCIVQSTGL